MSSVGLPRVWRGSNAGSCTPLPLPVCPKLRLLKPSAAFVPVLSSRPPRQPRRPPSAQSPFAQLGCYLRWGDVDRLLGGSYPSVVARTGSCAAPVGLSPPSVFSLDWRVLAGCLPVPAAHGSFPTLFPRTSPWMLDPLPGGTPCALTCFFHSVSGLPQVINGSASRIYPANDDFSRASLSRLQIFRDVPASKFARPPDRSYRCEYCHRAAGASTSGPIVLRCLRTLQIC